MLRLLALCAVSLLLATGSVAAAGERYALNDGSLSFAMPEGWTLLEREGKEPMALAPDVKETGLNINVMAVESTLSTAAYADSTQGELKKAYPDYKQLSKKPFTTTAGVKCMRLVFEGTPKANKLHQVMFIVPVKGVTRYLVTGSALASHGAASDALFDAAVKSLIIK